MRSSGQVPFSELRPDEKEVTTGFTKSFSVLGFQARRNSGGLLWKLLWKMNGRIVSRSESVCAGVWDTI